MAEEKITIEKLKLKDVLAGLRGEAGKGKGKYKPLKLIKLSSRPEIRSEKS